MIYFPQEKSSYVHNQADEVKTLRLIADRYIRTQPKQPFVYRAYHRGGVARAGDYRYQFNLIERFPDMKDGQYVYAWAKLWCEQESEWAFSLSCFGPVSLYVGGELAYKANIQEEVFPERRSGFRLKLKAGWNHFVLQFIKTGTGCGGHFGTGSIKGLPMHFIVPSIEREGQEGWLFTVPLDQALESLPDTDTAESSEWGGTIGRKESGQAELSTRSGVDWLPRAEWSEQELAAGVFGRLYGECPGKIAYVESW